MPKRALIPSDKERSGVALEVDEQLVDDISELLDAGQRGMVLNLAADLHPGDLARVKRLIARKTEELERTDA